MKLQGQSHGHEQGRGQELREGSSWRAGPPLITSLSSCLHCPHCLHCPLPVCLPTYNACPPVCHGSPALHPPTRPILHSPATPTHTASALRWWCGPAQPSTRSSVSPLPAFLPLCPIQLPPAPPCAAAWLHSLVQCPPPGPASQVAAGCRPQSRTASQPLQPAGNIGRGPGWARQSSSSSCCSTAGAAKGGPGRARQRYSSSTTTATAAGGTNGRIQAGREGVGVGWGKGRGHHNNSATANPSLAQQRCRLTVAGELALHVEGFLLHRLLLCRQEGGRACKLLVPG